jgi:hypothetical protein
MEPGREEPLLDPGSVGADEKLGTWQLPLLLAPPQLTQRLVIVLSAPPSSLQIPPKP